MHQEMSRGDENEGQSQLPHQPHQFLVPLTIPRGSRNSPLVWPGMPMGVAKPRQGFDLLTIAVKYLRLRQWMAAGTSLLQLSDVLPSGRALARYTRIRRIRRKPSSDRSTADWKDSWIAKPNGTVYLQRMVANVVTQARSLFLAGGGEN
jgi:hypothetical protein